MSSFLEWLSLMITLSFFVYMIYDRCISDKQKFRQSIGIDDPFKK